MRVLLLILTCSTFHLLLQSLHLHHDHPLIRVFTLMSLHVFSLLRRSFKDLFTRSGYEEDYAYDWVVSVVADNQQQQQQQQAEEQQQLAASVSVSAVATAGHPATTTAATTATAAAAAATATAMISSSDTSAPPAAVIAPLIDPAQCSGPPGKQNTALDYVRTHFLPRLLFFQQLIVSQAICTSARLPASGPRRSRAQQTLQWGRKATSGRPPL